MTMSVRLALISCFGTILAAAGDWSGALVDSKCYASKLRSANGRENAHVSTDKSQYLRYCSPGVKTTSFAIVQRDGGQLELDPTGNEQVGRLISHPGKKPRFYVVNVTGEMNEHTIRVESITMAK